MAIEVTVPRLGWSMDEGTFVEWLKKPGEWVSQGDMLFILEGDKAAMEVESFDEGILFVSPQSPAPGDAVRVGQLLAFLLARGESPPVSATSPSPVTSAPLPEAVVEKPRTRRGEAETSRIRSTPRARRRAEELGVDWTTATGTGREGRIRERDVVSSSAKSQTSTGGSIRQTIARRMQESHLATAPVTLTTTLDATNLVQMRQQYKSVSKDSSAVPSINDFVVKLTSLALRRHPRLNSRWEKDAVVQVSEIHIGLAVNTDDGLIVPVIRHADTRTLREIASASKDLIARTQNRKLSPDELRGGTFTVTNLGALGIDSFTPIINLPECAILGVGRIARRPAVIDDQLVARDLMTLSLTFDHRVVDGAPAARFLQTLSEMLENPVPALVE